jgi:hypothetical protein
MTTTTYTEAQQIARILSKNGTSATVRKNICEQYNFLPSAVDAAAAVFDRSKAAK